MLGCSQWIECWHNGCDCRVDIKNILPDNRPMTHPNRTTSLQSAWVYLNFNYFSWISPRQPDSTPPAIFGFWSINTPLKTASGTRGWLSLSVHFLSFSHSSWIPFTQVLFLSSLSSVLSIARCLLSGSLPSLPDTSSLSALCSEWQQTQAAVSLSQLPLQIQPHNVPTHAVDSINTAAALLKVFQSQSVVK